MENLNIINNNINFNLIHKGPIKQTVEDCLKYIEKLENENKFYKNACEKYIKKMDDYKILKERVNILRDGYYSCVSPDLYIGNNPNLAVFVEDFLDI